MVTQKDKIKVPSPNYDLENEHEVACQYECMLRESGLVRIF